MWPDWWKMPLIWLLFTVTFVQRSCIPDPTGMLVLVNAQGMQWLAEITGSGGIDLSDNLYL